MEAAVNLNGRITDAQHAVISVLDRGFLYGEGVYETLRTYHGRPFLLDRHLARLRASASMICLRIPVSDAELTAWIQDTMGAAALPGEAYIRILVTRGAGDLTYDPETCPTPTVVIIVRPFQELAPELVERGIRIVVSRVRRNLPEAINPRIKSNNLLNNALAMQEAIRAGAGEALMLNYRDEIAECAQSNFFLVRGGAALTPPLASGLLEGVTRNLLFEIGAEVGVPVREAVLYRADLDDADEAFITSTTREMLPVVQIDHRLVGDGRPGPVTRRLRDAFARRAWSVVSRQSTVDSQ